MAVKTSCVAILIALALSGAAAAETPADPNGRFTMSPVDGGFLRLDKQTGAVAMCARTGSRHGDARRSKITPLLQRQRNISRARTGKQRPQGPRQSA